MGFFDHKVNNSLEDMFDLNRDGELNCCESGLMMQFLAGEGVFADNASEGADEEDEDFYLDEEDE